MSSDEDVIIDHDPSEEHPQVLSNNNVPILWKAVSYGKLLSTSSE